MVTVYNGYVTEKVNLGMVPHHAKQKNRPPLSQTEPAARVGSRNLRALPLQNGLRIIA